METNEAKETKANRN